jgi:hypothetical protein
MNPQMNPYPGQPGMAPPQGWPGPAMNHQMGKMNLAGPPNPMSTGQNPGQFQPPNPNQNPGNFNQLNNNLNGNFPPNPNQNPAQTNGSQQNGLNNNVGPAGYPPQQTNKMASPQMGPAPPGMPGQPGPPGQPPMMQSEYFSFISLDSVTCNFLF